MREIKFRAWDTSAKKYRLFDGCHDTFPIARDGSISYYNLQDGSGEAEYVIEQFTGLYDKNGEEIYEGDILGSPILAPIHWCARRNGWAFTILGECACYQCSGDFELSEYEQDQLEIIGNIHENPELLND